MQVGRLVTCEGAVNHPRPLGGHDSYKTEYVFGAIQTYDFISRCLAVVYPRSLLLEDDARLGIPMPPPPLSTTLAAEF